MNSNSAKIILCIDDEPMNLSLLRNYLEADYQLKFACGGKAGLEALVKHLPDLVLLDVEMPEINGFDVALFMKNDHRLKNIPIIFVTALSGELDEQKGFDLGAVDYIHKPISEAILKARIKTHLSLVQMSALEASQRSALHMLGIAGHYNDTDTGVHIWRMAAYSRHLSELLGWNRDESELLELAAPMHDTGKIGIPDAILKKPGKLDAQEWAIMQTHSQIGYDILSQSNEPVFQLAADIALGHHEKWDGSGYPNGLVGEQISEPSRIVAVADVFDALTMQRPYKEAWPIPKAVDMLKDMSKNHLDRRYVSLFIQHIDDFLEIRAHWDKISE